jgi:signal transduction histidine kinase
MQLKQMLKSLHQNMNFTEKERTLALQNQELISENSTLKQELELKNRILKNIPIQFKNNINSIIGFSELLLNLQEDDDKQKQYLSNIIESAHLLNKEIDCVYSNL